MAEVSKPENGKSETPPPPLHEPKRGPSPMQTEMDAEPQPEYPSPMRRQMENFSLRRFFSILFYRQKKAGK